MSGDSNLPTHRPLQNSTIESRGYNLGITFHPSVKLEKKAGFQFGAHLSDFLGVDAVQIESHKWTFSERLPGEANSALTVEVHPSQVRIAYTFPSNSLEWFERKLKDVLETARETFRPQIILNSSAMFRGELTVDGDARKFLADCIMPIEESHWGAFGRPIHVLGLRVFFPAFEKKPKGKRKQTTDWQANLKIESLLTDSTKLFIEAEAQWPTPIQWSSKASNQIIDHLGTTVKFVKDKALCFLRDGQ